MATGAGLDVDFSGLSGLQRALTVLQQTRMKSLLDGLGAELESQTRRRIQEEKQGPDGEPWPDWSKQYAESRHSGHSLLENEGHLLDSIQYVLDMPDVELGSNLVYAAVHQHGSDPDSGQNIPARPFIGVSTENEEDLIGIVNDFMSAKVNEAGL